MAMFLKDTGALLSLHVEKPGWTMKLCKDCKHAKDTYFARCTNPKVAKISKSNGEINKVYCDIERMFIMGNCGHFAWHFERKEQCTT